MLGSLFWSFFIMFWLIFLVKVYVANHYHKAELVRDDRLVINEQLYTIVQPLSKQAVHYRAQLLANLKQTKTMKFIWIIEEQDRVSQELAIQLLQGTEYEARVLVYLVEGVPQGKNIKNYKLAQIVDALETPYMIVLEEDCVIDKLQLNQLAAYEDSASESVITGAVYSDNQTNFWSGLLEACNNSQSIINHYLYAAVGARYHLTNAFYVVAKETALKLKLYDQAPQWIDGDLAIASVLADYEIEVIQSSIVANRSFCVNNEHDYLKQAKLQLIKLKALFKFEPSLNHIVFILIPLLVPGLMVLFSIFSGFQALLLSVASLIIKAIISFLYRGTVSSKRLSLPTILYEGVWDMITTFVFIYTSATKPLVYEQGYKIDATNYSIHYLK